VEPTDVATSVRQVRGYGVSLAGSVRVECTPAQPGRTSGSGRVAPCFTDYDNQVFEPDAQSD